MVYFESLKLHGTNEYYGLTYNTNKNKFNVIISDNNEYTTNLYQFIKTRENYISGRCFISENDITQLNSKEYNNLIQNDISFCDSKLVINSNWTVNQIINYHKQFLKKNNNVIIGLLDEKINKIQDVKYKKLTEYNKVTCQIKCSLIKEKKLVLVDLTQNDFLNNSDVLDICQLCEFISMMKDINIIIFLNNKYSCANIPSLTHLNSKKNFYNNQLLSIGKIGYEFRAKRKLFANFLSVIIGNIRLNWKSIISYTLINVFLLTIAFIALATQFSASANNITITNIIQFAQNNRAIWNIICTFILLLSTSSTISWFYLSNFSNKKYYEFLKSMGMYSQKNILLTNFNFYSFNILTIILSNTITIIVCLKIYKFSENYWIVLNIFVSMCYFFIINVLIGIYINKNINRLNKIKYQIK